MVGTYRFACRHRNAPLCVRVLKVAIQEELTQTGFNSIYEKRQTILCISVGKGRPKSLFKTGRWGWSWLPLSCHFVSLISAYCQGIGFLDWYPILIHVVDSLVPNSGSRLCVQWHSWQTCFLNIFPDPLYCVMFGSMLGFQGECIFKNIAVFLINSSQQMSLAFRSKLMC